MKRQEDKRPADLVFLDGPVFTADPARSWTDAIAVREGKIIATGRSRVADVTSSSSRVVSLQGRMLMPGVIDAHAHPIFGGLEMGECDLAACDTLEELGQEVRAFAAAHPNDAWITGGGWAMSHFAGGSPTRAQLDQFVPDRPAILISRDRHAAWLNSRALEAAGITKHTPEPKDGRIEREADGTPAGTLHEGAVNLATDRIPQKSDETYLQALLQAQSHLHSLGITAWHDALIGSYFSYKDSFEIYLAAQESGALRSRAVLAQWWDRDQGMEQLAKFSARRARAETGRVHAGTVKLLQDGICESFTAHMFEPYHDHGVHRDLGQGNQYFNPEKLREIVDSLDHSGFQIHAHTIGDHAISDMLDAFEHALDIRPPSLAGGHRGDNRHQLTHLQVMRREDISRMRRTQTVANIQPLWACVDPYMSDLTLPFLGEERAERQYLFGDLIRSGVPIAAGSDWPVSSADPMRGAHVAVNRTVPEASDGAVFLPEQRIALTDVLAAYTSGSAYANHLEDSVGSIEVGKEADLVVLDRNPFDSPAKQIFKTQIAASYVLGECVYER